jgi:hypothetical protein
MYVKRTCTHLASRVTMSKEPQQQPLRRLVDQLCPVRNRHGLPGMPGMPGLSGLSGLPGMPGMPGLDLRLGPTLPPEAAIEAARGAFDDLSDLKSQFEELRARLASSLRACACAAAASASASATATTATAATATTATDAFSFARCILQIADPTLPLRSDADVAGRVAAFVERTAGVILADPRSVADAYLRGGGGGSGGGSSGSRSARTEEVLQTLRDPVRCLSDEGLSNAVIQHLVDSVARMTVVVRRGGAGSPCHVFALAANTNTNTNEGVLPATATATKGAAVLVDWQPATRRFELVQECAPSLQAVRRFLVLGTDPPSAKATMSELTDMAASCAVRPEAGASSWRSRAQVRAALEQAFHDREPS